MMASDAWDREITEITQIVPFIYQSCTASLQIISNVMSTSSTVCSRVQEKPLLLEVLANR